MKRPFGRNLAIMLGLIVFILVVRSVAPERITPTERTAETGNTESAGEPAVSAPSSPGGETKALDGADERAGAAVGSRSVTTPSGDPLEPLALERIEPRAPLSPIARAKEPEKPDTMRLFRPVATAAGRLETPDRDVVIAGIEVIEPGRECETANGDTWPCGMRARTAFRSFLRGRALDCKLPQESGDGPIITSCALAEQDLGEWLVTNGWAAAADAGPYAGIGKTARDGKRGIFGGGDLDP